MDEEGNITIMHSEREIVGGEEKVSLFAPTQIPYRR
jgi:hypothetical protein